MTRKDTFVEVAHEAVIHNWPQLRKWIDADRAGLRTLTRLTEAAREWENAGRDAAYLYSGARLALAEEWSGSHPAEISSTEAEFLRRGLEARKKREADDLEAAQRLAHAETERANEVEKRLQAEEELRRREVTAAQRLTAAEAERAAKAEKRGRLLLFSLKSVAIVGCCALAIGILIVGATFFPYPTPLQNWILKAVLATAAAIVVALFVQFFHIKYRGVVGAGTATVIFSILLTLSPVALVTRQLTDKDLISWWKGDGNTNDEKNMNTATATPNVSYEKNWQSGYAFGFDKKRFLATTTIGFPTHSRDRTLEFWVLFNEIPAYVSGELPEVFLAGYGTHGTANEAYDVVYTLDRGLSFTNWGGKIGAKKECEASKWYYVVVTNSGSDCKLYVDGRPVDYGRVKWIDTSDGTTFYDLSDA